jgi:hypothetical protein
MTKFLLSFLLVLGLVAGTRLSVVAQTPLDYFQLGQFLQSTTNSLSVSQYGRSSDIKAKLSEERRSLVKLGAPTPVLTSFDHMVNSFRDLPWSTSYASWTQTQKDAYSGSAMDWSTINAWLGTEDTSPRFYFWLGFQTNFIAKMAPSELNNWGYALADVQPGYKGALSDFAVFQSSYPVSLKTALPDVQAAIAAIAPYNGKTLTKDDVTALQAKASIIYADANGRIAQ